MKNKKLKFDEYRVTLFKKKLRDLVRAAKSLKKPMADLRTAVVDTHMRGDATPSPGIRGIVE